MNKEKKMPLFLINDIENTLTNTKKDKVESSNIDEIKNIDERIAILEAKEMTKDLLNWPGWESLDKKETLIIFPGNGAEIVKIFLNSENSNFLKEWENIKVDARREWKPGENPRSFVDTIGDKKEFFLKYKDIIVIDDVISSGSTIQKLYKENEAYFPNAKWRFLSWVSLPETNKTEEMAYETFSSQNLNLYDKNNEEIIQDKNNKKTGKKPPINSISTFLEKKDRAENYARRNLGQNADNFLGKLEKIKE